MRFIYGIIAMGLWAWFLSGAYKLGIDMSNEIECLTTAIVVAGAMAGGNK